MYTHGRHMHRECTLLDTDWILLTADSSHLAKILPTEGLINVGYSFVALWDFKYLFFLQNKPRVSLAMSNKLMNFGPDAFFL